MAKELGPPARPEAARTPYSLENTNVHCLGRVRARGLHRGSWSCASWGRGCDALPQDGKSWPAVVLFRNSETAQNTRDVWLQNALRPLFGKDKDLGLRPARYLPSRVHRRVHDFVPAKGKGKGQGRSPKQESEARDERGDGTRRRV